MKFPRRLAKTKEKITDEGFRYCEETDPDAAFFVGPEGMEMLDIEAERNGIADYFKQVTMEAEVKAVAQSTVEDKAVAGPDEVKSPEPPPSAESTDDPGQTPETRRTGSGRRGS